MSGSDLIQKVCTVRDAKGEAIDKMSVEFGEKIDTVPIPVSIVAMWQNEIGRRQKGQCFRSKAEILTVPRLLAG